MKTVEHCNVLIVGGGPAGLFTARELRLRGVGGVVLIDSGSPAAVRNCPLTEACNCTPCDVLEGIGGSGGVSDGKLTFALDRGTQMERVFGPEHEPLLDYIRDYFVQMNLGGVRYDPTPRLFPDMRDGIYFDTYPLWHVGSDGIREFSQRASADIQSLGVQIYYRTRARNLLIEDGQIVGVAGRRARGGGQYESVEFHANHVVLCVGLFGIGWLENQLEALGVEFDAGPAGIGLRVETPTAVLDPLFDEFYDWKAVANEPSGITLRSFCCNRAGHIMPEYHRALGIRNVNGHSFLNPEQRTGSSNFSLQVKIPTTKHPNPSLFVRSIARQMNSLSNGWQVRQPAAEFLGADGEATESTLTYPQARRTESLRRAMPLWLYRSFADYLKRLDRQQPGIIASGWLYGPEVKYHARKVPIGPDWRLQGMERAFIVGDSTGLTGSYVSAALTGIIAARAIASGK